MSSERIIKNRKNHLTKLISIPGLLNLCLSNDSNMDRIKREKIDQLQASSKSQILIYQLKFRVKIKKYLHFNNFTQLYHNGR